MAGFLLFLLTFISLYLGIQYTIAFWLIRHFPALGPRPAAVRCGVLLLALSLPAAIYVLRRHGGAAAEGFAAAAYVWLGVSFLWFWCAIAGNLAEWAIGLAGAAWARQAGAVAVPAVLAGLCGWSFWNAARPPALRTVEVALPNLPAALDGFTVVQVSDLHLGATTPAKRLRDAVERVNEAAADLVVLTGDFMDPGAGDPDGLARYAAGMKARHGKLAVLGNHEFYLGLPRAIRCYELCGARLLRNEAVTLPGGLQVLGLDDVHAAGLGDGEVRAALAGLDPAKPSIVLSHQPRVFGLAAEAGAGLVLAGHTHGGQIFPFHLFSRLYNGYLAGLYSAGRSRMFVTVGAGHWGPPMRLGTRAEVVRLVLRPARSADAP